MSGVAKKTAKAANEGDKAVDAAMNQMDNIEKSVLSSAQLVMKLGERSEEIGRISDVFQALQLRPTCLRLMLRLRLPGLVNKAEVLQ